MCVIQSDRWHRRWRNNTQCGGEKLAARKRSQLFNEPVNVLERYVHEYGKITQFV